MRRPDVVAFDARTMPALKLVEQPAPRLTERAKSEGLQGLVLTKCVLTANGSLEDCCIEKGADGLDGLVFAAVRRWRYEPLIVQGKAVRVELMIPVRIVNY